MAVTTRHYVHFLGTGSITVALTEPDPDDVVTTAQPTFTWTLAGGSGVQSAFRFRIATDSNGLNLVYDSGWTPSATLSHVIPAGALTNGVDYYAHVEATDTNGAIGESDWVHFTTAFAASSNIANVRISTRGQCADPLSIPVQTITWDAAVEGAGEDFTCYLIRRRTSSTAAWETIGSAFSQNALSFIDYTAIPWQVYEYSVIWVGDAAGSIIQSDDTTGVVGVLQFDHLWIHDVAAPTYSVRLDAWKLDYSLSQDIALSPVWGVAAPRAMVGEAESARVRIQPHPQMLVHPSQWEMIRTLITRQRDNGSILCLRHGRSRTRLFVNLLSPIGRTIDRVTDTKSLTFAEVDYDYLVDLAELGI